MSTGHQTTTTGHALSAPQEIRRLCRDGLYRGPTSGCSEGFVQANLMILPREDAFDFLLFCQRNPKPCPLVEVLEPGQFESKLAIGSDLRTDLPGYRVLQKNLPPLEVDSITNYWRDDLVSFLIGCSFSFETALLRNGIRLRHIEQSRNVAMYRTNHMCQSAGRFSGNMVVSMRPIKASQVALAVEISARFPNVHGAPIHVGNPSLLGINDLEHPDFGDPVSLYPDELPVFWACGVTPQVVAQESGIEFCLTHAPGKMFVTDQPSES